MERKAYPGFEYHLNLYDILAHGTKEEQDKANEAQQKYIKGYTLPEGMTMEDRMIPGTEEGTELRIRVYTPAGLPEKAPVVLEIHGGGWVAGNLDIDNYRCIYLAEHTPCIVVGVEYRLTNKEVHFPAPLLDCYTALCWVHDHAAELGADPEKIGLHGTSAGGNLVGGLALYVRDHGGPEISLAVMNCPAVTGKVYTSTFQNEKFALRKEGDKKDSVEHLYMGGMNGGNPSYYAMPGYCEDLDGLCPIYLVIAEYDPLRDEGLEFAARLLQAGVPCELNLAPRVGHGFCVVDHPLTRWVHDGVCASFRREFGML